MTNHDRWHRLGALIGLGITCFPFAGCSGSFHDAAVNGVPKAEPAPPTSYDMQDVAHDGFMRLVEVRNRKSGKVHLVLMYGGVGDSRLIKLEEWTEEQPK